MADALVLAQGDYHDPGWAVRQQQYVSPIELSTPSDLRTVCSSCEFKRIDLCADIRVPQLEASSGSSFAWSMALAKMATSKTLPPREAIERTCFIIRATIRDIYHERFS